MDESTFQRLRLLFDALVALPPSQRRAEIDACSDLDEVTRRRLYELLHWDADSAHLTAATALAPLRSDPPRWIGARIGAYVVEQLLGEGGMGSVYRASRVAGEIEQQVAIKIARRQVLDDAALARFRLERQVLALLQHPQIATMHDLGELADGTPYIVMEYVQGRPLLDDVAARGLGLEERLRLFLLLCDAVAYAHRNLVVHRDIKPGNVLVTADGLPKLLDFGIAKPLHPRLGAVDVEQTSAAHRYFSLRNAAPEQLRGEAVGVTCDVYGLGSLLYELLCGQPSYDFDGMSLSQIERRIAEDDPLPPSRRIDAAAAPAWQRSLPRDLDAIVLKALRRDPQARYANVDLFAEDLRRYLGGYPVSARDPSLQYRAGRFARRHRVALATGLLFAAVVGVGIVSWLRQYYSTLAERDRAESVTRTIVQALQIAAPPNLSEREVSARVLFEQVGKLALAPTFDQQPATRVQLATTVARIQYHIGLPAAALSVLERADSDTASASAALRDDYFALRAEVLVALADDDRAFALIDGKAAAAPDAVTRVRWQLLEALAKANHGDHADVLPLADRVLASDSGASRVQRWQAQYERVYALLNLGRGEESLIEARRLYEEQRDWYRSPRPELLLALMDLQAILQLLGDRDESEHQLAEAATMCRQIYEENGYACLVIANKHASVLGELGRLDEAVAQAESGLTRAIQYAHGDSELVAQFHFTLALLLQRRGDIDTALVHVREAVRIGDALMSEYSQALMRFRLTLTLWLLERGDVAGANAALTAAEATLSRIPQFNGGAQNQVAQSARALVEHRLHPSAKSRGAVDASVATAASNSENVGSWQLDALKRLAADIEAEAR